MSKVYRCLLQELIGEPSPKPKTLFNFVLTRNEKNMKRNARVCVFIFWYFIIDKTEAYHQSAVLTLITSIKQQSRTFGTFEVLSFSESNEHRYKLNDVCNFNICVFQIIVRFKNNLKIIHQFYRVNYNDLKNDWLWISSFHFIWNYLLTYSFQIQNRNSISGSCSASFKTDSKRWLLQSQHKLWKWLSDNNLFIDSSGEYLALKIIKQSPVKWNFICIHIKYSIRWLIKFLPLFFLYGVLKGIQWNQQINRHTHAIKWVNEYVMMTEHQSSTRL